MTPLDVAEAKGHTALVQHLSSVASASAESYTLTVEEQAEIDRFRERHGSDVKATDSSGQTLLYMAVLRKDITVVKFLISKGADVNARDNLDMTPLHFAVTPDKLEIVKSLVSAGANINAKPNKVGATPLETAKQLAKTSGDTTIVQYLSSIGNI